jgi:hypothetical protein
MRSRDLVDAWRMLAHARREPQAIEAQHLDKIEAALKKSPKNLDEVVDAVEELNK